ncbi:uncharacterized protein G2W53_025753 [Senna tora]|uniref:Uncharacterized protein n=1 Tax=Senna tora TaxID=362788 RepID=A0A834TE69_9FABA|nr:uncharacterized protein G2W53_025753 [Senna tora]
MSKYDEHTLIEAPLDISKGYPLGFISTDFGVKIGFNNPPEASACVPSAARWTVEPESQALKISPEG